MALYGVTIEDILAKLNQTRKKLLTEKDVFNTEVKVSLLKKIDEFFKKGLAYYLDPKDPIKSNEESIFFRKDNFNADLNLGAKQIVNKFEEDKISFTALAKLADFKIRRRIPVYKLWDNPKEVAGQVREYLYPEFNRDKRVFLKNFIAKLAEFNILVFEFIETHNKKEKANINGVFLAPNVIVLKRNQKALRREVFTLAHELGHYLLNEEEIDGNVSSENLYYDNLSETEKWCNDFAFFFLVGKYKVDIEELGKASSANDYHNNVVNNISQKTHLSTIAIYTRFLINNIVSPTDYNNIVGAIKEKIKEIELAKKEQQDLELQKAKLEGRKVIIPPPKPIISPLYLRTLQSALYSGLINEMDFCKKLSIKPEKLDKYLI